MGIFVVGIIAAAACLVPAGAGKAGTSNTDPTGDAKGGAPDITRIVTSNDATGLITFRITTVAAIIDSSDVGVALDTDANPGTGGGGAEYVLVASTGGFGFAKWNGSTFAPATAPSLTMTRSGNVGPVQDQPLGHRQALPVRVLCLYGELRRLRRVSRWRRCSARRRVLLQPDLPAVRER